MAGVQGFHSRLRGEPVPAANHPRAAAAVLRVSDPPAAPVFVHAAAGRPVPDSGADEEENQAEIAKFSERDAEAYPRYNALLERIAKVLEPILARSAPDLPAFAQPLRRIGLGKRFGDMAKLWELYQAFASLGTDLPHAIELLTGAAKPILERWFEAEVLRATIATDAIIGAFAAPSMPGTAYVLLHHVMGEAGGARGIWGYVAGGMGGLANALERACHDLHVEVRREAEVQRILVSGGRTIGVQLASGVIIEAPVVASSADAHWTFERMLGPSELPEAFRAAVAKIDYSSASAKINLALGEPPQFTCLPSRGIGRHHHGTMHICPTMDYIERAYDDAKYGLPSKDPVLEMTMASSVDRSIVPEGKHLVSIFVQYAPYRLAHGRHWDEIKEDFADRCIEVLARYAPNLPHAIEHRQVVSPLDLERTFGLTGGNIMQGAMHPHQLYAMRPVPGWADHRTPIKGLYLCGAASHPGGGVIGACGKNAAEEILRDA